MKHIIILSLLLIISSCCTTEPIIITKKVLPQEVTFPKFPKVENIEYSDDETIVYVPSEIWQLIAKFGLEVKKTEELYLIFRQ